MAPIKKIVKKTAAKKVAPKKVVKKVVKKVAAKKVVKKVAKKAAPKPKRAIKRVPTVGRKAQVLRGTRKRTSGGLKSQDLMKNKRGKVVSRKQHAIGQKNKWLAATMKARKALGIRGFVPIKKGTPLYAKALSFRRA
jgi:hypothetical protein